MNEIKWNDRFNIGIEAIDKAHRRLFSIVNKLIMLNEDPTKQRHACHEGIKYFQSYTLKHFSEEEEYMRSINYNNYATHKALHDNMRDHILPTLERELEQQKYSVESVQHFMGICIGWLNSHIMIEDRAIIKKDTKWVNSSSQSELEALEDTIILGLRKLFLVTANLVSDHYSGENFSTGKKGCFRFNYISKEGERLQIFIVYEDRLILHCVSRILGQQIKKIDKTALSAINFLSKSFISYIKTRFNSKVSYKLDKEDILSFEQFLRVFDKEYPVYSMLFGTGGNGYFVFCVKQFKKKTVPSA